MAENIKKVALSDLELVMIASEYYIEKGVFVRREWMRFCKENGYPQTFSKNRFDGKYDVFVEKVRLKLGISEINTKFYKSDKQKENKYCNFCQFIND